MDENARYARAKQQVEDIRRFYKHLAVYITINVFLFALNFLTGPGTLWFFWVTVFWGIGLVFHAFEVFGGNRVLGRGWEEKKIREIMEREERR
jgi:hypothetical protein